MEKLCQELIDLIVCHVFEDLVLQNSMSGEPNPYRSIIPYAFISRSWQYSVERFTMNDIFIYSSEMGMFRQIFASPPRRQALLRSLHYGINLPSYGAHQIFCFETKREHRANQAVFQAGVVWFFNQLASWSTDSRVMDLTLDASSRMDTHRRHIGLHCGLGSKRWTFKDRYLALGDGLVLPQLPFVRSLNIHNERRSLCPSTINKTVSSMPGLEKLDLKLTMPKPKRAALQGRHRRALAAALESPSLRNLRSLRIEIEQMIPQDHSFQNQSHDPSYPNTDVLNIAVRNLAATSRLRHLYLMGSWPVSPALFDGSATFPFLERVNIQAAPITYDGRWFFTGNPPDIHPESQSLLPQDGNGNDNGHAEGIAGSDSSSSVSSSGNIDLDEEARLNGQEPVRKWRTKPDPDMFNPLMEAMAAALLKMPELKNVSFTIGIEPKESCGIEFEYLAPGEKAKWILHKPMHLDLHHCWVTVMPGSGWKIPENVSFLLRKLVA